MEKTDISIGLYSKHFHNHNRRGVAIYTHELVKALSKLLTHVKVDMLDYFWPHVNFSYLPQLSNPHFRTKILRCPGRIFEFLNKNLGWPRLESLSKNLDLIHFLHEQVSTTKIKNVIMTVHDLGPLLHPELYTKEFRSEWKRWLDHGLKKSTKVIAVSETVEKQLHSYCPRFSDKYYSTFLGVSDLFLAEPNPRKDDDIITSKGINFPYILFVGAADPKKNLIKLIEAFSVFLNETKPTPPHRLVLIGNPRWGGYDHVRQMIARLGITDMVHFTGYIHDEYLSAFYRKCDLFVFPALFEGFGLPLLEAMASGAPCLVSNRPSLDEVGGNVVDYCDPESVEDMADKLKCLIENPERRSTMGIRGKKYARQFTWERTAQKTIRIYEEVLDSPIT